MSVCLKAVLFVFLTLTKAQAFVVGQSCGQLFSQTDDIIAYIVDLSQNQKLSVEQMSRLYEALKNEDKFINPYTEQDAIKADAFIHWQKFEELVKDGTIDKKKLEDWLRKQLREKERVKVEKNETRQETQDPYVKIQFNPIRRGKFRMGEPGKQALKKIDYDFEMMGYPITQRQYALVTGENPSGFIDGPHTIELEIKGKKIKMQPDNPVEMVSSEEAENYAEKINELSKRDDPLIYEIIPDHVKGAKYRLPTEIEWEYVARNEGSEAGEYSIDPEKLPDYGWFAVNSNNSTHPVGEKLPQIINGRPFEMIGNVAEWVQASRRGKSKDWARSYRGTSWYHQILYNARVGKSYYGASRGERTKTRGFRLVRTLP